MKNKSVSTKKHFWSSGQSLVEVTVASVALIFGLVSVISGLMLAVRNSTVSSRQVTATQESQEVIEVFRKFQRQLGWESFYGVLRADGTVMSYCLQTLPTTAAAFQSMPVGACTVSANNTDFVRQADVVITSANEIELSVTVTWRDGNTTRLSGARNIFRNYQ